MSIKVNNDLKRLFVPGKVYKGYKFIITGKMSNTQTVTYIVQQRGARSWVGTLLSVRQKGGLPAIVEGNSKTILTEVVDEIKGIDELVDLQIHYTNNEVTWRMALIEALGFGTVNQNKMEVLIG